MTVPAGCWDGLRTLLGGKAERFGMYPPVVLGQRLAGGAGRQATVRSQISQRVTGNWVTVTGNDVKMSCSCAL